MILGKVIGTVWATRKDDQLTGMTMQIVQEVDLDYRTKGGFVVAVDSVGAGVGEIVIVVQGSSARQTLLTRDKPVDAVIAAIVDKLDVNGEALEKVQESIQHGAPATREPRRKGQASPVKS